MRLRFLAAAGLLAASLAAHADDLFVFQSGSDTLTFTLPSSPTPTEFGGQSFDIYEDFTFDGVTGPGDVSFYVAEDEGGFHAYFYGPTAYGEYNQAGAQLFSGTPDEPTFISGSYNLTDYYGEKPGGVLTITEALAVTPEPSSFALLGTGLLGVAGALRKRFA